MNSLLKPLQNATYRRLFSAQVVALLGTGLTTIALSLLAYELAETDAGIVVGIALGLKMVAYVVISPLVAAWTKGCQRKGLLIGFDLGRAAMVLMIPFVTEVWQVYVLIFGLNSFSAGFTPTFQATIPDVLPDTERYTEALSLSRLAYDLEMLLSPVLAAALLGITGFSNLFVLNGLAFLFSASLVASAKLPRLPQEGLRPVRVSATGGIRRYLATPRLRALLALTFAASTASAMVLVNTVVYARNQFGLDESAVAWALGSAGAGSMIAALLVPTLAKQLKDRTTMSAGGFLISLGLVGASIAPSIALLASCWFALGIGMSLIQTPAGRLIRGSAESTDRAELFAAQFSLSHCCWLVTYPLAGVLGTSIGLDLTADLLSGLALFATLLSLKLWRPRSNMYESKPRPA